jgi:hypothetical protein
MPDLFDELEETQKKKSFPKYVGKAAAQFGKSATAGFTGTYGDILSLIGLSPKENLTPGQKALYEAEFGAPESVLPFLQEEDILPRYSRLPTTQEVGEFIGEVEPETRAERYAQRAGRTVGGGAALGGGAKTLTSLATASGIGQTAKELGAPESVATTLELLSLFGPHALANKAYGPKKMKELIQYARKQGLTEEEIAGIVKGERMTKAIAKFAKKGGKTERLLDSIQEKAGNSLQSVKETAKGIGPISGELSGELGDRFVDILTDLKQTIKPSSDKQLAINFIEEAIENLMNKGTTPEQLINFWQDINSEVNWNAIRNGKKSLDRLKEPIKDVLTKISPSLAKDFELGNTLYARSKLLSKALKPTTVDHILDKGPLGASMLAIALGDLGIISKFIGADIARTMGREMIFNPKIQNISKKMLMAIKNENVKGAQVLLKIFKKEIEKDNPDIFDNIDTSILF